MGSALVGGRFSRLRSSREDIDALDESIKKLIEYSDKILLKNTGYTGRITTGYNVNGVPLQQDQLVIKIYITVKEKMGHRSEEHVKAVN